MDRSKQFWLRFYLPITISIIIIIIASFTNNQVDSPSNDLITDFNIFGKVSIISLLACHTILFLYNIFKKYQNKVYNIAGYICFTLYFALALSAYINKGIVEMIIIIYTFSALYVVALLLDVFVNVLLKSKTMKTDIQSIVEIDKSKPKNLPKGWLIRRDVYIVQGAFVLMLFGLFFVPIVQFKFLYIIILIGIFLAVMFGLSYKQQNLISKYLKEYADTLDLDELRKKFEFLKENHLHPETISKIDLLYIDVLMNHDFQKAETMFKNINPNDPDIDKLIYKLVEIDYHACYEDYDICINLINELFSNKVYKFTLHNLHSKLLYYQMMKNNNPDIRVLNAFPLDNQHKINTLINKMIHAEYYYFNKEYDKAAELLEDIINDNHPLETLRNEAKKYLTTIL